MKKKITLLGSTGSIGKQTLDVVRHLGKDAAEIKALSAYGNWEALYQQAIEFDPEIIAVYKKGSAAKLRELLPHKEILEGEEGIIEAAAFSEANFAVSAISGTLGLKPTVKALETGKTLALANKEALVSGGSFIIELARKNKVEIIPVDSEHSAIFQCLKGNSKSEIARIVITASGGPFRNYSMEEMSSITSSEALNHPTWKMGSKITIDCSTLMNKGLEVIEAHFLFDIPVNLIEVIIHPESVIHSMVEYKDGSMMAQMSCPTMHVPIQYALTYPERKPGLLKPFDFSRFSTLHFQKPDFNRFACLKLALDALSTGRSMPCFMNGANEVLVEKFMKGDISWLDIPRKLDYLMENHHVQTLGSVDEIIEMDLLARRAALETL